MSIADFALYPTGNWCNASPAVTALPSNIRPLIPGMRIAGRARTARIPPGQNAAIHEAVHNANPGDMLLVDGAASTRYGPFGDLLAECCIAQEMAGAVLNCAIRDSADIAALGFQIFSRGFHPEATSKAERGEVNIPISVGGVAVKPGDILVGDNDGVVVIPSEISEEVLVLVADVARRESEIRARILAGETTFEILELGQIRNPSTLSDER